MTKKLIVGSPQAMEREPLLCEVPRHEGNVVLWEDDGRYAGRVPRHRRRCDNPECWCNDPRYRHLGDDPKYRKGHADGVQEMIDYINNFGQ